MNAANPIDRLIALKRIQHTLKRKPDDVESLLQLAVLVDTLKEPDRVTQRQLLERVLALEPTNSRARAMLVDIDRAEMGAVSSQPLSPLVPLANDLDSMRLPALNDPLEKPFVSRYSLIHQILVYPVVGSAFVFSFMALRDGGLFMFFYFASWSLLLAIPVWFVSAVARVSSTGLTLSRLFGVYRREVEWTEIQSIQAGPMGVGLRLNTNQGWSLSLSSQMTRYPAIVEILQQARPDLFRMPDSSFSGTAGSAAGSKVFRKGFLGKYWLLLLSIATSLIFLVSLPTIIPAIILGIMLFFMWDAALHGVHTVMLEGDRLTTQSLRRRKEMNARQVSQIDIVTRYSRRGVATRMVQVKLQDGTDFVLAGFPEGNEILYGFLKNWWEAYLTT